MSDYTKEFISDMMLVFGLIGTTVIPIMAFVIWDWGWWTFRVFIAASALIIVRSILLGEKLSVKNILNGLSTMHENNGSMR